MNNNKYIILLLLLIVCSEEQLLAQSITQTGSRQIVLASADEIKKAQAAVEVNPDSLELHKVYIRTIGLTNPLLLEQYRAWVKKYPENVNIPLAIATAYHRAEMPQAKEFLLKVAEMEPKNAKVWSMLADDAFVRGQKDMITEYSKKAMQVDTSNANYAVAYLRSFEDGDPNVFKQKVFEFVKRFPTNERGAQALYSLGEDATDVNEKISDFEELRKLYPPQKFSWSASGMIGLADDYLQTDPEKALALINEMGDGKSWQLRKQVAETLIQVDKLEQSQSYKEAINKLDKLKLPKFNYINDFITLKKASLWQKSGDVKAAYDSIAVKFAKLPTDQLYTALEFYGTKIGKDKAQIVKDIGTIRNSKAVAAYPFELGLYTNDGKLNLNDLKGKVVLLTFWFPDCSPCRVEFPHFQAVINKFKAENVAYVGINVSPQEDPYVIPMLKNTKYSFIPLHGTPEFAEKYYNVQSEPENFLIDKDGKIIFKDFRIDNSNHRTLELMISSLLEEGGQGN